MKNLTLTFLAALSVVSAQPLIQGERDRAMSHLHATRKMLLDSVDGLSPAQWNFKPAPDRWSIAECAEHITVSEDTAFQLVTEKIMTTPPEPDRKAETQGKDELVLRQTPNRERKFQAPESVRPIGRWKNRDDMMAEFKLRRDRTIAYAEQTGDELRSHFAPHPALGLLDGYQWLLFISAHSERHIAQILEVRAAPNFPGKRSR